LPGGVVQKDSAFSHEWSHVFRNCVIELDLDGSGIRRAACPEFPDLAIGDQYPLETSRSKCMERADMPDLRTYWDRWMIACHAEFWDWPYCMVARTS